jgi:hypothetical protein
MVGYGMDLEAETKALVYRARAEDRAGVDAILTRDSMNVALGTTTTVRITSHMYMSSHPKTLQS